MCTRHADLVFLLFMPSLYSTFCIHVHYMEPKLDVLLCTCIIYNIRHFSPFFLPSLSLFLQHLTPLELVKAARKASGDSAEVGTGDDLWGSGRGRSGSTSADTTQTVSCTSHVCIHVAKLPSRKDALQTRSVHTLLYIYTCIYMYMYPHNSYTVMTKARQDIHPGQLSLFQRKTGPKWDSNP